MTQTKVSKDTISELQAIAGRLEYIHTYYSADFFKPNAFQTDFFTAGSWADERLLSCGNQSGKTLGGGMELSYHATGRYPNWWQGKRFKKPIRALVVGITFSQMRDACQRVLLYANGSMELGTGTLPKDCIIDKRVKKDGDGAYDYITIHHEPTGGTSYLKFVTQGMPWENIMGDRVDVVWGDEALEDMRYYEQLLARITATEGIIYVTCTPEHGYSPIYKRYEVDKPKGCYIRYGSLEEVTHLNREQINKIINRYPEHVRAYRVYGKPFAGAGMVIPVSESVLKHPYFDIPPHWKRISGVDFGYSESLTAIVWFAIDPATHCLYLYDCFSCKQLTPEQIFPEIHRRDMDAGYKIPMAWPRDGSFAERSTGIRIAELYRSLGVNMLPEAAFLVGADGKKTFAVEAGVQELLALIHAGRFKIMVREFTRDGAVIPDPKMDVIFQEQRVWGRDDDGKIKKTPSTDPHHWDAIRYAVSMVDRYANNMRDYDESSPGFSLSFSVLN